MVVFYLGPWLIVPSVVFMTIYLFGKYRNNVFCHIFLQPSIWIFFLISIFLFAPAFVGVFLVNILNKIPNGYLYCVLFTSFILALWITDRNNILFDFFHSNFYMPVLNYIRNLGIHLKNRFILKKSFYDRTVNVSIKTDNSNSPNKDGNDKIINKSITTFRNDAKDSKSSIIENAAKPLKKVLPQKMKRRNPNKDTFNNYFESVNLKPGKRSSIIASAPSNDYFQKIIDRIEEKLLEFKIDGKIINVLKGPVVDTFELELGSGVKVSKVTSSAEDLSLALYGAPIRIVYPMKGRTTVGIEVPRNPREVIYLDELLNTREFKNTADRLPLAMGKDAFGLPFIVDLVGMPHMLVAGATGAGQSVFINTILVSLLVKKTPEEMKLILIDPKQLELALYSTLPHLIMPVVTDAKRASLSLLWAVDEMERRYSVLKEVGVRNIDGYNEKLAADPNIVGSIQHHFKDDERNFKLPYIVIIVDEFADLILTKAGKEIENNICRLAAKARAAGIHLIIATQRPSVDVITGLIKSNFPTRVSFRVTTSIDSRTILNSVGAERLLGKGDMLYKHGVDTVRVHSSFVDEVEIEKLTYSLAQFETGFDDDVIEFLENGGEKEKDPYSFGSHLPVLKEDAGDELFDQAVEIVTECRSASASMLQRRLKIGYNRAANLVELMEDKGIVGPAQGSKPRKVLTPSK